ncbi:hypothetical protein EIP91_007379 [Steccherinum ochraceum]|uniref:Ubiquitin 3 binding protein But2 C-terminal domain-containing protein n=1 Tax=Steccherinum ochraceum TaxID=92696 RepID=A0A4R0RWJ1_9APHY|nr:hypothetical protein EIP91_007379 [Steccherinum ochraceum]
MKNAFASAYEPLRDSEESIKLLASGSQSSDEDVREKEAYLPSTSSNSVPSGIKWLGALILAVVLVDIGAFMYIARLLVYQEERPLPIRNTYVGLDDLYAVGKVNTSTYAPIENRPRVDAQVSISEPKKVFPVDRLRWLSTMGRMSPPDLRLHVTDDMHTIVQFRVIDYGMERCQFAIRLPPRDVELPDPFVFPSGVNALHLNICELDAPEQIDVFKLTYATRPRCAKPLGAVVVSPGGEAKLPEFPCKWSEHHAYEISCAEDSPACMLDVRATQYDTWGAFMYQYQTV